MKKLFSITYSIMNSKVEESIHITPEIRKLLYRHQTNYYNNNKSKIMDRSKKSKQRNREEKKFFCEPCQKAFSDKTILTNHLKIKKHNPSRYVKYVCEFDWCSYETTIKTRFTKHMDSLKHRHYK